MRADMSSLSVARAGPLHLQASSCPSLRPEEPGAQPRLSGGKCSPSASQAWCTAASDSLAAGREARSSSLLTVHGSQRCRTRELGQHRSPPAVTANCRAL